MKKKSFVKMNLATGFKGLIAVILEPFAVAVIGGDPIRHCEDALMKFLLVTIIFIIFFWVMWLIDLLPF